MSNSAALERTPLVISAGDLVCGTVRAPFREGDAESLLTNYLVTVRQVRGQRRNRTITLREDDLTTLAGHLGSDEVSVLDQLLDLMGATRGQRTALLAMLAAGALTVVATGTIVLNVSVDGVSADTTSIVDAEAPAFAGETVAQAASVAGTVDPVAQAASAAREVEAATLPAIDSASAAALTEAGLVPGILGALDADVPAGDAQVTEEPGTDDSGATVAVAPPPVPPTHNPGVGTDDSGATVAVAPPPVPPTHDPGVGTDDSGATVAVAPPPVPPSSP